MEKLYYISGNENEEYWNLFHYIKSKCNATKFEWNGDYTVETYEDDNKVYHIWTNEEYGIQSLIETENK